MTALTKLQLNALADIIRCLDGMKCRYAIIAPDGSQIGDLVVKPPKPVKERKRAPLTYKYGELTSYVRAELGEIKPGVMAYIRAGNYTLEQLQAVATSHLSKTYGNGSYSTEMERNENRLAVLVGSASFKQVLAEISESKTEEKSATSDKPTQLSLM